MVEERKNDKVALWVTDQTKARVEALGKYKDTHEDIVKWMTDIVEEQKMNRMLPESEDNEGK